MIILNTLTMAYEYEAFFCSSAPVKNLFMIILNTLTMAYEYEAFFCASAPVHWCTDALVHQCTICNSLGNQHHTHSRRLRLYKRNLINLWTLACGQPTWFNLRLVSSVGRVPVCQVGGHGFKPRPDQQSGSLNNWEESAAFVMTSANG